MKKRVWLVDSKLPPAALHRSRGGLVYTVKLLQLDRVEAALWRSVDRRQYLHWIFQALVTTSPILSGKQLLLLITSTAEVQS